MDILFKNSASYVGKKKIIVTLPSTSNYRTKEKTKMKSIVKKALENKGYGAYSIVFSYKRNLSMSPFNEKESDNDSDFLMDVHNNIKEHHFNV